MPHFPALTSLKGEVGSQPMLDKVSAQSKPSAAGLHSIHLPRDKSPQSMPDISDTFETSAQQPEGSQPRFSSTLLQLSGQARNPPLQGPILQEGGWGSRGWLQGVEGTSCFELSG